MAKRKKTEAKKPDLMGKTYVVSDGELVLHMTKDEGKWYCVTSPMDPELTTQAKTIPEAFEMARDAMAMLKESREYLVKEMQSRRTAG